MSRGTQILLGLGSLVITTLCALMAVMSYGLRDWTGLVFMVLAVALFGAGAAGLLKPPAAIGGSDEGR